MLKKSSDVVMTKIEFWVKNLIRTHTLITVNQFAKKCDISPSSAYRFFNHIAYELYLDSEEDRYINGILLCNKKVLVRAMQSPNGVRLFSITKTRGKK